MASDNDRAAIRQAYLDYLGREASEADVEGWATGQFGGGGLNDWLNQIRQSGEGQAYAARGRTMADMVPGAQTSDIQQSSGGPPTDFTGDPGPEENTDADTDVDGEPTPQEIEKTTADYRNAESAIQRAYQEHLGRAATDPEIKDWWSGRYGWGDAQTGLDGWLRGIEQSPEAQTRRGGPASTPAGPTGGSGQAPGGYDQTKWESDHDSVKYAAGRFLSGLTKPSEISAMVKSAAFQERFPGATFNDKDKIDFGDNLQDGVPVGVVDVLMRADQAGDTSGGFWWGAGSGDGTTDDTGDGTPSPPLGGTNTGAGVGPGDTSPAWAGYPEGSPLAPPQLSQGPNTFGMGPGVGGGTMGQMMTPYNPLATYSPEAYVPPAPYRPPAYAAPTPFSRDEYVAATPFEAPTAADMAADPSYQFRLQQGQDALERSGAARGVTNTGGTLKDILDYGQNAASQEYGNVYGRMRDTHDMNERNRFNAYESNFGNAMDAYGMNEDNRSGAFNTNVRNAENAYNTNEANRFKGYTTNEGARLMQNQTAENRRAGAYDTNARNFQDAQNFGLRAQNQGWNQGYQKWVQQYNQQSGNRRDTFNMMDRLAGAQ